MRANKRVQKQTLQMMDILSRCVERKGVLETTKHLTKLDQGNPDARVELVVDAICKTFKRDREWLFFSRQRKYPRGIAVGLLAKILKEYLKLTYRKQETFIPIKRSQLNRAHLKVLTGSSKLQSIIAEKEKKIIQKLNTNG